ncbi:hypothetical protein, partial [Methylomonas methanica]
FIIQGATQGCGALPKGQEAPFGNPRRKLRSAGNKRRPGGLFFWILFFGQAKKSISPVGARTDIQKNRRVSDTKLYANTLANNL